ncbi:MAG TPA: ADOP family duplicated permease [Thermoanaerobaculia bacterium]|nr:ADOP family duplicated permease [Thermoanaerobaculia bacterium]
MTLDHEAPRSSRSRLLPGRPGLRFSAVMILFVLAVGLGPNAALWSIAQGLVLRPLPYPDSERLVRIFGRELGQSSGSGAVSLPELADLSAQSRSFSALAAARVETLPLAGGDQPRTISCAFVSPSLFAVTGLGPALGRSFQPEEGRPGAGPVVVLSHGLWQAAFGGDRGVLGRSVQLDGLPTVVIGVLPPWAEFPDSAEAFVPITSQDRETRRDERRYALLGRLAPGVTLAQARAELSATARQWQGQHPEAGRERVLTATPLREVRFGRTLAMVGVITAVVFLLLVLASVNVANLLLQEVSTRSRELALRRSLGAERRQMIALLVREKLPLFALGGLLGVLAGHGVLRLAAGLIPYPLPPYLGLRLEPLAVGVAFAAAALVALGTCLLPGLEAAGTSFVHLGGGAGSRTTPSRRERRRQRALVVAQVGLSVVLLIAALAMVRTFLRLQSMEPGFPTRGLLATPVPLARGSYPGEAARRDAYQRLMARVGALPGVERVAVGQYLPFAVQRFTAVVAAGQEEAQPGGRQALFQVVGGDYFGTLGLPLLKGRAFTPQDDEQAVPVVVISARLARRLWGEADPLGQRLRLPRLGEGLWTVVGVVGDTRFQRDGDPQASVEIYLSHQQTAWDSLNLFVRTAGEAQALAAAVQGAVRAFDAAVPLSGVLPAERLKENSLWFQKVSSVLVGLFAFTGLVLALAGVFSTVASSLARRASELSVRVALGAQRRQIMTEVLRQLAGQVSLGIALGLAGAFLLTPILQRAMGAGRSIDLVAMVGVPLAMVAVCLVAALPPLLRALRFDPSRVLQDS